MLDYIGVKSATSFTQPGLERFCGAGCDRLNKSPSHLILFEEHLLRTALTQFQEHYHEERNLQGKNNVLLFPAPSRLEPGRRRGIRCRERLGGLLRYYSRAA